MSRQDSSQAACLLLRTGLCLYGYAAAFRFILYPFSPDSLLLRGVEFDLIELRSMNCFQLPDFALSPLRGVDFDLWQFALRGFDLFQLRSSD